MPSKYYKTKIVTVEDIINEKIKVLQDFYIVDAENEESIRNMLITAVRDNPHRDPNVVVDGIAKTLIAEKL